MVDGIYDVRAKTPLGKKKGQLAITSEGDICHAVLSIAGKTKELQGPLSGNATTFTGTVKLPFPIGKVDFTIDGTIEGDRLVGVCRTKKFHFDIHGERVA